MNPSLLRAILAALFVLTAGLQACGGRDKQANLDAGTDADMDATEGDGGGQTYSLEVVGGFGSGSYAAGTLVHVWADLDPAHQFLTSWSGDDSLLDRPAEWHSTLTMPARSVQVTAQVETRTEELQVATFQGTTSSDKTIRYFATPNPVGLILLLHGTGGSSRIIEKEEGRYLALAAVARGYAVLAPEAEEVAQGDMNGDGKIRWNASLTADNVDLANLNALVDWARTQGIISADTPLFVMGMSNGGAMSVSLGALSATDTNGDFPNLRFQAAVSYCASGRQTPAEQTTTPTAWLLCANDDNDEVSNDKAVANSQALADRGIPTMVDAHPASPLYPERFARVEGISKEVSAQVAQELEQARYIGPDGMFNRPTDDIVAAVQADSSSFPVLNSLPLTQISGIVRQIKVMQAEHQLYSDWANRTIDFFDEYRQ